MVMAVSDFRLWCEKFAIDHGSPGVLVLALVFMLGFMVLVFLLVLLLMSPALVFFTAGRRAASRGRLARAEWCFAWFLSLSRVFSVGRQSLLVGLALSELGRVQLLQQRWQEGVGLVSRALKVFEQHKRPQEMASALTMLASAHLSQGRDEPAERLGRRALTLLKQHGAEGKSKAFPCFLVLGTVARRRGRFDDAEAYLTRAVELGERLLGPDDQTLSIPLETLGSVLSLRGRPAEAEPMFRRALAVREKKLGPRHPLVAQSLRSLAAFLEETNRISESDQLLGRAVAIESGR